MSDEDSEKVEVERSDKMLNPTCDVCGKVLMSEKVLECKECGAVFHRYCRHKHVLEAHSPETNLIELEIERQWDEKGNVIGFIATRVKT